MKFKQLIVADDGKYLENDFRKLNLDPYSINLLIRLNNAVPCLNKQNLDDIYIRIGLFIKFQCIHKRRAALLKAIESMVHDQDYFYEKFGKVMGIVDHDMKYKKFNYEYWYKNYFTDEEDDDLDKWIGCGDDEINLSGFIDDEYIDIDEIYEIGAKEIVLEEIQNRAKDMKIEGKNSIKLLDLEKRVKESYDKLNKDVENFENRKKNWDIVKEGEWRVIRGKMVMSDGDAMSLA